MSEYKWIEVKEEVFFDFIKDKNLIRRVSTVCEPALVSFHSVSRNDDWCESMVCTYRLDHNNVKEDFLIREDHWSNEDVA